MNLADTLDTLGIDNCREAVWSAVILFWMGVTILRLLGLIGVSVDTLFVGTKLIIVGLMAHVVWINLYRPSRSGSR